MTRSQFKKTILAMLLTAACAGFIVACGSNEPPTPQGQIVKGPVSGAAVYDANGNYVGTTNANGYFPMTGTAPYSTGNGSLGTYQPLTAGGGLGTAVAAPPLQGYSNYPQITPLTTILQIASANGELAGVTASLNSLGIDVSTLGSVDLSENNNVAAFTLNETLGAVLASINTSTPGSYTNAINAITTALASTPLAVGTPLTTVTDISNAVTTVVTSTINTASVTVPANLVTDTASIASTFPPNTPTTPTGSTGGTGGTGGNSAGTGTGS
jgi:hypothetical protein